MSRPRPRGPAKDKHFAGRRQAKALQVRARERAARDIARQLAAAERLGLIREGNPA